MNQLLKKPSAWLPILMSLTALAILLGYIAIFGINQEPQPDEGTAAHLFQILMGGQALIIACFAIRYIGKFPEETFRILTLQILTAGLPFGLLYFFEHWK